MIQGAPVNIVDYGASPSATASENATAIQAAANAANATGGYLVGAPGVYTVDATIQLECNGDLGNLAIEANANSVSPIVRFGTATGAPTSYKRIVLPSVRNNSRATGTWGVGIAVELANCNTCQITVVSATECETGVYAGGYTSGFAYNTVSLMFVYSNKINMNVGARSVDGWSNQNTFIAGRLGTNSADFTVSGYTGTRDIIIGNSYGQANNNIFLNTSLESADVEYSIEFKQQTAFNQFQSCRYEGAGAKRVLFNTDNSSGNNSNLFIGGYQASDIVFSYSGSGSNSYNSLIAGRSNFIDATGVGFSISTGSSSQPHLQGFEAGTTALGKTNSATNWVYRVSELGYFVKPSASTYQAIRIAPTGYIYLGTGTTATPESYFREYGADQIRFSVNNGSTGSLTPAVDNVVALGQGSNRMSVIYAATGSINTSDAREKQDIEPLAIAEKRVAVALKGLVKKFRFKDAVDKKGLAARIHVGVVVQEIIAAFQAEGLDAMNYAMVCYDKWEAQAEERDENGLVTNPAREAGDRYGIRYEELLAFIIGAM